ncbi:MAG: hypothetical protein IEMM0002_1591 [bacterium]|nr:MAG: hypothetical protein IEMM0002_1591 [bacterium]
MKRLFLIAIALGFFSGTLYAAADNLYVQSKKAKVMSEPKFSSKLAGWVKRGDRLSLIEKGKGWYKVSFGELDGWVNRLCVSDNPPIKKVRVITEDSETRGDSARKRASAITSAAAARGLSDADRKRLSDMGRADYKSLGKLEVFARSITELEVGAFMTAGGEK